MNLPPHLVRLRLSTKSTGVNELESPVHQLQQHKQYPTPSVPPGGTDATRDKEQNVVQSKCCIMFESTGKSCGTTVEIPFVSFRTVVRTEFLDTSINNRQTG